MFPVLNSLKSRSYRYFCLSISYISANKSVHDTRTFHIIFSRLDRQKLILRLLKGKHLLKLLLPNRILAKNKPLFLPADSIEFHQILRHFVHGASNLGFCLCPFLCTKFVELWLFGSIRRSILLNYIKSSRKHIKISAITIFNLYIILNNLI